MDYRFAKQGDEELILSFIKGLAEYEHMKNEVTANPELLHKWLFEEKKAEVIFPLYNEKEAGFALFFNNFSTFLGKPGIYLEDLFILPEYRGKGLGKGIFKILASISKERSFGRVEWCCLDWNEPSIQFYLSLGAEQLSDWTTYRLTGKNLESLAE